MKVQFIVSALSALFIQIKPANAANDIYNLIYFLLMIGSGKNHWLRREEECSRLHFSFRLYLGGEEADQPSISISLTASIKSHQEADIGGETPTVKVKITGFSDRSSFPTSSAFLDKRGTENRAGTSEIMRTTEGTKGKVDKTIPKSPALRYFLLERGAFCSSTGVQSPPNSSTSSFRFVWRIIPSSMDAGGLDPAAWA